MSEQGEKIVRVYVGIDISTHCTCYECIVDYKGYLNDGGIGYEGNIDGGFLSNRGVYETRGRFFSEVFIDKSTHNVKFYDPDSSEVDKGYVSLQELKEKCYSFKNYKTIHGKHPDFDETFGKEQEYSESRLNNSKKDEISLFLDENLEDIRRQGGGKTDGVSVKYTHMNASTVKGSKFGFYPGPVVFTIDKKIYCLDDEDTSTQFKVTANSLVRLLFHEIKRRIEADCKRENKLPDNSKLEYVAAISCPPGYSTHQRNLLAGLALLEDFLVYDFGRDELIKKDSKVRMRMPALFEPISALIGFHNNPEEIFQSREDGNEADIVYYVVIDFGGGTTDICLLKSTKTEESISVVDVSTVNYGGRDVDRLVQKAYQDVGQVYTLEEARRKKEECEDVNIATVYYQSSDFERVFSGCKRHEDGDENVKTEERNSWLESCFLKILGEKSFNGNAKLNVYFSGGSSELFKGVESGKREVHSWASKVQNVIKKMIREKRGDFNTEDGISFHPYGDTEDYIQDRSLHVSRGNLFRLIIQTARNRCTEPLKKLILNHRHELPMQIFMNDRAVPIGSLTGDNSEMKLYSNHLERRLLFVEGDRLAVPSYFIDIDKSVGNEIIFKLERTEGNEIENDCGYRISLKCMNCKFVRPDEDNYKSKVLLQPDKKLFSNGYLSECEWLHQDGHASSEYIQRESIEYLKRCKPDVSKITGIGKIREVLERTDSKGPLNFIELCGKIIGLNLPGSEGNSLRQEIEKVLKEECEEEKDNAYLGEFKKRLEQS